MCLVANTNVERARRLVVLRTNEVIREGIEHKNHLLSEKEKLVIEELVSNSNSELCGCDN